MLIFLVIDADGVLFRSMTKEVVISYGVGKANVHRRRLLSKFRGIGVSKGRLRVCECRCGYSREEEKEQDFGR